MRTVATFTDEGFNRHFRRKSVPISILGPFFVLAFLVGWMFFSVHMWGVSPVAAICLIPIPCLGSWYTWSSNVKMRAPCTRVRITEDNKLLISVDEGHWNRGRRRFWRPCNCDYTFNAVMKYKVRLFVITVYGDIQRVRHGDYGDYSGWVGHVTFCRCFSDEKTVLQTIDSFIA